MRAIGITADVAELVPPRSTALGYTRGEAALNESNGAGRSGVMRAPWGVIPLKLRADAADAS